MGATTVVILESGSRWPTWLGEDPAATRDVAVIAQRAGETLKSFKRRATRRIRSFDSKTAPLTGVLVCSGGVSTEAFAFRHAIMQKLMGMMQAAQRGHVVLVADGDYAQQRRLAWLAAGLNEQLDESSLVSLRFRTMPRLEPCSSELDETGLRVA
jgi:hypothetical protein